eukprot:Tbor_TRINITY_DN5475_c1_g5::TRINITY_DN5475_c1_g5_i1::g.24420::m.24420
MAMINTEYLATVAGPSEHLLELKRELSRLDGTDYTNDYASPSVIRGKCGCYCRRCTMDDTSCSRALDLIKDAEVIDMNYLPIENDVSEKYDNAWRRRHNIPKDSCGYKEDIGDAINDHYMTEPWECTCIAQAQNVKARILADPNIRVDTILYATQLELKEEERKAESHDVHQIDEGERIRDQMKLVWEYASHRGCYGNEPLGLKQIMYNIFSDEKEFDAIENGTFPPFDKSITHQEEQERASLERKLFEGCHLANEAACKRISAARAEEGLISEGDIIKKLDAFLQAEFNNYMIYERPLMVEHEKMAHLRRINDAVEAKDRRARALDSVLPKVTDGYHM